MTCLGVHFSLSPSEVKELLALTDDAKRRHFIAATIEPAYFEHQTTRLAETEKAWDAIHHALSQSDGADTSPLDLVVLGGERLHGGDDYIIALKTPEQVRHVATLLSEITEADFRRRYFAIDATRYEHPLDARDLEYTWFYFANLRTFWLQAAAEQRYVIFTVDQ